jgi:hypothetical protein
MVPLFSDKIYEKKLLDQEKKLEKNSQKILAFHQLPEHCYILQVCMTSLNTIILSST